MKEKVVDGQKRKKKDYIESYIHVRLITKL